MATECPSFLKANVMRVTRLNNCGQPQYGGGNMVVSDGFVSVKMSAEVEEGEEINVTKANGKTCISDKPCDQLKWYEIELEFCEVDYDLVQIINPTAELIRDAQDDVVGVDMKGDLDCDVGFGMEIWLDIGGQTNACLGQEAQGKWGYLLLPWCVGGAPGDLEIGNEGISFNFTGRTKMGSSWRRGPYPVVLGKDNIPDTLPKPVTNRTQYQLFSTTLRPPEPECGAQPVDRPTPEPAELRVTGLPNEDPRRTVRLWIDNHGFGPVMIDWGDGGEPEESLESRWVTHAYAEDQGNATITVRDKETPAVKATKRVSIPLSPDDPQITLSCPNDETQPLKVSARVEMPPHSDGKARVDWGDGSDPQEIDTSEAEDSRIDLVYIYRTPSIYTVSVRRTEQDRFRARDAIQVPCQDDGDEVEAPQFQVKRDDTDASGRTAKLVLDGTGDGGTGGGEVPRVKVSKDETDPDGYTARVLVDNTTA